MNYLSADQALFIHQQMIERYGGAHGVRDHGLLELAVAKPRMSAFGEDAYPTLFLKAAALLYSIANNHPFLDGNKRTAFGAMHLMLLKNGYDLTSSADEEVRMCLEVATGKREILEIAGWLEKHSKQIQSSRER